MTNYNYKPLHSRIKTKAKNKVKKTISTIPEVNADFFNNNQIQVE